ncbi:MAG TPA: hypothetical protein VLB27_07805, partial [candidate division Zixibacteria bacterium]|nr:hypothetical protein [candidate division Zixibacteria bacterium]
DSTLLPIKTTQLALRGDTLFALDEYNGVLRFVNPAAALDSPLEYLWLPFPATSFTLSQEQIVFSDGDNGFKVAPYDGDNLSGPFHATQTVSYAYRTLETDSNYIIISSPNVIEVIAKDDPGDVRFINVQGNTQGSALYRIGADQALITPSRRRGLAAYLMTTPGYPKDFARYDHPGPVRSLEYVNGFLYTAGPESPFEKYEPLGAGGPELLGARSWPSGVSWSDALGDTLYLVDTSNSVDLLWLARTLPDSLPRPINTFGLPSDIDRLEVFPDPPTGRKFFVMRRGNQYFINRAEQGQLFGSTTVAANLGVGVTTLSVAQGRVYHYSSKGVFVVSLLSFFNNIVEVAIVPVPYSINEILPVEDQRRLLLFSPFEVRLMDISTAERHDVLTRWDVVGNYNFARRSGELIYAVGPNSTGVLRYRNGSLQELAHLPVGATSVAGGDGLV